RLRQLTSLLDAFDEIVDGGVRLLHQVAFADLVERVPAQGAVALELGLAEELVARGLVREFQELLGVVVDVPREVVALVNPWFDVNELSILGALVDGAVTDRAQGEVLAGDRLAVLRTRRHGDLSDLDRDAKVGADLANGVPEVLERAAGIGTAIAQHDPVA